MMVCTSCAYVLRRFVDLRRELRDLLERIVGEREFDAFGIHQRHILLSSRARS